jgi:hypothetical protein
VTHYDKALLDVTAHRTVMISSGNAADISSRKENIMTLKTASIYLASTLLTAGFATSALAQSASGSIQGTVLDPSGALIPQAQVTITNANGFSRTLTSDSIGAFALPNFAAGSYTVSINAIGFTPALESIEVAADKVSSEDVKLGISVAQEIEVSADDAR